MLMNFFGPGVLGLVVKFDQLAEVLVTTLIFVLIGLVFFAIAFFVLEKTTPFSIRKEIEDDQNVALGIVIGSLLIGIAIIIAAAIQG
jgi:putative membrane protein